MKGAPPSRSSVVISSARHPHSSSFEVVGVSIYVGPALSDVRLCSFKCLLRDGCNLEMLACCPMSVDVRCEAAVACK
jgi:hypothetical protein